VNSTEADDSVASTTSVVVGITAVGNEANDSVSSVVSVGVTANVAVVENNDTLIGNAGGIRVANLNVTEHSDSISSFIQTVVEDGLIYIDPGLQPYTNGDLVYYTSRSSIGT
jgi:hypothetical protein